MKDILIIGASGLLGSNLLKHFPDAHAPSKKDLNVRKSIFKSEFCKKHNYKKIKTVINCAAIKNVEKCEYKRLKALKTNIIGMCNLALFCNKINSKLVYISTDYVFRGTKEDYKPEDEVGPISYYGETKLAGEIIAKSVGVHLIIRLSFSQDIFPYEKAFVDQISTKVTVSEAASKIFNLVKNEECGIKHIVGKKQSVYEFAKKTKKSVKEISLSSIDKNFLRPRNTSLSE